MSNEDRESDETDKNERVELGEGLRKGLDLVDASTPPVDDYRPELDDPGQTAQVDANTDDAGGSEEDQ